MLVSSGLAFIKLVTQSHKNQRYLKGVSLVLTAPPPLSGSDEILPAVARGACQGWPSGLALLLLCSLLVSSSLHHLLAPCQPEIIADP